jgi:hypothetical protein
LVYICLVRLHSSVAQCSCTVQLHSAVAQFSCTVQLHSAVAQFSCTVQLHSSVAQFSCTVQLHSAVAQCSCTVQLHGSVARFSCTVQLHSSVAQCSCTVQLHSSVAQFSTARLSNKLRTPSERSTSSMYQQPGQDAPHHVHTSTFKRPTFRWLRPFYIHIYCLFFSVFSLLPSPTRYQLSYSSLWNLLISHCLLILLWPCQIEGERKCFLSM